MNRFCRVLPIELGEPGSRLRLERERGEMLINIEQPSDWTK